MSGNIYELLERRNVDALAGEVWDDSECCDWTVEDQAIEFGDDVCVTPVLRYDDEWAEISHTHFAIERLLDGSISDQDEVAKFEVVLDDGSGMILLKTDCGVYVRGEHSQVGSMFVQGDSVPSNEVGQGKRSVEWRRR